MSPSPDDASERPLAQRRRAACVARSGRGDAVLPVALDRQLRADAGITHMDYMILAMLSEALERRCEEPITG